MEKKTKKLRSMTLQELEERVTHCIKHNQQNSRYYLHIMAEITKRSSKDE